MGAVFALGRRRDVSSFWSLLLSVAVFLSFRSKRDVWFVITVAITIISITRPVIQARADNFLSMAQVFVVMVASIIMLGLIIVTFGISNSRLEKSVAVEYPVGAANFIDEHQLMGPMYNHFDWGGYLIWRLPSLPVSIDGRSNLHDATRIARSAEVWSGKHNWASDPELEAARIVIAQKDLALTQLLRVDGRVALVYEDDVALVFVRNQPK
jgi:hypothetical protein